MEGPREFAVVANVVEPDSAMRLGAKVWIVAGNGYMERFEVRGLSRGGRRIMKFVPLYALDRWRAKWVPDGQRDLERLPLAWGLMGRAEAEAIAAKMQAHCEALRAGHPNRKTPPERRA